MSLLSHWADRRNTASSLSISLLASNVFKLPDIVVTQLDSSVRLQFATASYSWSIHVTSKEKPKIWAFSSVGYFSHCLDRRKFVFWFWVLIMLERQLFYVSDFFGLTDILSLTPSSCCTPVNPIFCHRSFAEWLGREHSNNPDNWLQCRGLTVQEYQVSGAC